MSTKRRREELDTARQVASMKAENDRAMGMRCMFETVQVPDTMCNECGAAVYDRDVHYAWHKEHP